MRGQWRRRLGFDVIHKNEVTRSAFNNHWQDFLNKLAPGDTAALFFAGHGVELGGRNYLLPRDVPNLRPGREELLRRESLSVQEFMADLRLAVTEPPEGTFIMFSAGSGESALDHLGAADSDPNSVYTRQLLPLLRAPGVSLTEVAEQVRVGVRQIAATVQHKQTPAYYNQVLGRVCLAGGDCGPREGNPAAVPVRDPTACALACAMTAAADDLRRRATPRQAGRR
jgi:uncharacterized caspase-like protein